MTITALSKLAGIFGWPISHSRSPLIHNYWLNELGIDGAYVPLATPPEDLVEALKTLPKLGFLGANVTVPHKQVALTAVDVVSETARAIGAVNTVVVKPDGALLGTNTDAEGFLENLKTSQAKWNEGRAVVVGAGGAARAVIYALRQAGVSELSLANRTKPRAEELAASFEMPNFKITVHAFDDVADAFSDASLLVNTTSLGMTGELHLDMSLEGLPSETLVTDLVYTPLQTALLKDAQARGNPTLDGLGMLLYQAVPGFEAWFGVKPKVTNALRALVLADLNAKAEGD